MGALVGEAMRWRRWSRATGRRSAVDSAWRAEAQDGAVLSQHRQPNAALVDGRVEVGGRGCCWEVEKATEEDSQVFVESALVGGSSSLMLVGRGEELHRDGMLLKGVLYPGIQEPPPRIQLLYWQEVARNDLAKILHGLVEEISVL